MELQWKDSDLPYSKEFDDIYYADESGLEECRYLFIGQNNLLERWKNLNAPFVIQELGFGTGLNFIATWMEWKKTFKGKKAWLHFNSCEKYPLTSEQIRKALSRWPELDHLAEKFLLAYRDLPPGFHRFIFAEDQISLTLYIGDAFQNLRLISGMHIDAWFLDGFAPRKNPEMWNLEIFNEMARLSKSGTSFATYTSAGHIKRNLREVGFAAEKFKGFGRKREMLKGQFVKPVELVSPGVSKPIHILGGGFAGISAAYFLSLRGFQPVVFEKNAVASGASGNLAAITLPTLTAEPTVLSRFSMAGFYFLKNLLREFSISEKNSHLLQLETDPEKFERRVLGLETSKLPDSLFRLVSNEEASDIANIKLNSRAIWMNEALSISMPELCQKMIASQNIEVRKEKGEISGDAITILANGFEAKAFKQTEFLPLRNIRGQIALLRSNAEMKELASILCFGNYLTPSLKNNLHLLGATYDNDNLSEDVRAEENLQMIENLKSKVPSLSAGPFEVVDSRVSFRCSVAGQAPVVGKVDSDLYTLTSLGSRGSIYGPLAAEYLASEIAGEPLPIENDLQNMISPQRFTSKNA